MDNAPNHKPHYLETFEPLGLHSARIVTKIAARFSSPGAAMREAGLFDYPPHALLLLVPPGAAP